MERDQGVINYAKSKILKYLYFEVIFELSQFAKVVLRTIQIIMERDFPDSYRRDDFKLSKNEIFSSLEKKLKIVLQAYEYCK